MTNEEVEMLIKQKAAEILEGACLGDNVKEGIASIGEIMRACIIYADAITDGHICKGEVAVKIFDAFFEQYRKPQNVPVIMMKPSNMPFTNIPRI